MQPDIAGRPLHPAVQGAVPQMPPHELEGGPTPFMTQLPPPHPPSAPSPSSGAL